MAKTYKVNKKHKHDSDECLGSCFDCAFANYICEGDFLCDAYDDIPPPVVVSDWQPTENYCKCGGKRYKPV